MSLRIHWLQRYANIDLLFGMEMLTKTMALEFAAKGIRINGIDPGAIATMMNIDVLTDANKKKKEED